MRNLELTTFGDRLRFLVGTGQPYAWAAKVGIPKGTFTNMWRSGGVPRTDTLAKIVSATGCRLEWLVAGTGEPFEAGALEEQPSSEPKVRDGRIGGTAPPEAQLARELEELQQSRSVDETDLLAGIIVAVERWIKRNDFSDDPERKAALIALLFSFCKKAGKFDEATLEELLKGAA